MAPYAPITTHLDYKIWLTERPRAESTDAASKQQWLDTRLFSVQLLDSAWRIKQSIEL